MDLYLYLYCTERSRAGMPMNTASDQVESSDGALYEDLENDSGTTAAQYSCLQVSTSGRQPAQTGRQPPGNSENYMNLVV